MNSIHDIILKRRVMKRLVIYRSILKDTRADYLNRLTACSDKTQFSELYFKLCSICVNNEDKPLIEQILDLVYADENIFSLSCERRESISPGLREAVLNDLQIFKELCRLDFCALAEKAGDTRCLLANGSQSARLHEFLTLDIDSLFLHMQEHYRNSGCGIFHDNKAFLLGEVSKLIPVPWTSFTELNALYDVDTQKRDIVNNTKRLVSGLPAQNILLYGDSGTGKSTMVKAMLPEFPNEKLCLIEVDKDKLRCLPKLLASLSERGMYFIIFIDDLSFEYNDEEYKILKTVMQGGLYESLYNIRFYVTSNRRNIVKQDMKARENEVNVHDFLNETISLTDRFGLKIYFESPVKKEYIEIVKFISSKAGLTVNDEMIEASVRFAFYNGGFNGRSARQFVDSIITETK